MKKLLLAGAAIAAALPAQNRMGTFDNTGTTYATRGGAAAANTNPADLFVRLDKEKYAGFTTGLTPGTREITGLNFVMQDQNLATQEPFNLIVYTESATTPNFPDVTTPVGLSGAFGLPIGTGGGAYNASANFATPLSAPAAGDVFVGLRFTTPWTISGGQVTDGPSVWEIRGVVVTATGASYDLPGPGRPSAPPEEGTFGGIYVPTTTTGPVGPAYPITAPTMYKISPVLPIAGGCATAVTNQANHVESTSASVAGFTVQAPGAGTACMMSGLHPDSANPPLNGGRADDIGAIYVNTAANVPTGSPVFFLIDLGTFGPEIPVSAFIPGSTGVVCLNLGTAQTLAITLMGSGFTSHVATFPASARSLLSGISWLRQTVGFNVTTGQAHAGPCTRQQM